MEDKNALILAELLENGKRTVFVRGGDDIQKMGLLCDIVSCLLKSGLHKDLINDAVNRAFISADFNEKIGKDIERTIEKLYSQITPEDFARANAEGL